MFKILNMNYRRITPGKDDLDRRLDRVIRKSCPGLSLGEIYKHLRKGHIRISGRKRKPDYRLIEGDILEIAPFIENSTGNSSHPSPINEPATGRPPEIIRETEDLLVVCKAAGRLVHGPSSLETSVSAFLAGKLSPSLSFTPGPLHRLDRNTSGAVTFGKSLDGARRFTEALQKGEIGKYYLAVMEGRTKESGCWEDNLTRSDGVTRVSSTGEGQTAVLRFRTLFSGEVKSLVLIRLFSGRTHQIRCQSAHRGHSLYGDVKYGGEKADGGFFLHAWLLTAVNLPPLPVEAPIPVRFLKGLSRFFPATDFEDLLKEVKKSIFSDLEEEAGKYTMGR